MEEKERLEFTIDYLKKDIERLHGQKYDVDDAVERGKRHFNFENSQGYIDLMINAKLQDTLDQKLKNFDKALLKPYFARVNFTEDETGKFEELYIGKISLMDENYDKSIIVDWRAPVANLYYEGRLGKANYDCIDGNIKGTISLKRQFTIEKGELLNYFDVDITTNDDFLQASLKANADDRLKDIVSTIQGEQNKVIRANMWKNLIVQGAAGGGKTTIALHRIAYLLYTYEKSCAPNNFMIIAPNRFFLSYISNVLPELGVENVKQSTFEDFTYEVLERKLKLKETNEKLIYLVGGNDVKTGEMIKKISRFKSSLIFKDIVNEYMDMVKDELFNEDLSIANITIMSSSEIKKLFNEDYKDVSFIKRTNEIKKYMENILKKKKMWIISAIEKKYDKEIKNIKISMEPSEERRVILAGLIDKRDEFINKIDKASKDLVRNYLAQNNFLKGEEYYKNMLKDRDFIIPQLEKYLSYDEAEYIIKDFRENLSKNIYELEDLAPMAYINNAVWGISNKINLKQVVIDEAQDFSMFQFFALSSILKGCTFTILGDVCQGIHSYRSIRNWDEVRKEIFNDDCTYLTLVKSYRTTIEIMNEANKVLSHIKGDMPQAVPVIRNGENVLKAEMSSYEEIVMEIKEKLELLKTKKAKSIAIICKNEDECKLIQKILRKLKMDIPIISSKEKNYIGGTVIVPSYLSKGLEFDAVIIANASKNIFADNEMDLKLLYVSMTRALHRLYIYSIGEMAEALK